jgi:hypothetical protein
MSDLYEKLKTKNIKVTEMQNGDLTYKNKKEIVS